MQSRIAVLATGLLLVAGAVSAQGVAWRTDLAAAQQEAAQSNRLVLLHFWSTSCGPCMALEKNVFNQPAVATGLERQFVPVKLTEEQLRAIAPQYGVTRIPTDVILTPDGQVVRKMVSPSTPMEYVGVLGQVAAAHSSAGRSPYDAAVAAAPSPGVLPGQAGGSQVMNNAYAGLGLPPAGAPPVAQAAAQADSRYGASAPQAPVAPVQVQNPYAGLAQNPPTQAPVGQPPVAQQPVAQPPAAQQPITPIVEQQRPAVAGLPAGAPPLGFDGYCTVSMKRDFKWVKGDASWGAIHRGRTYLFASKAERDEFMKTPDAFCPVLSGADPVVAVEQNMSVPGKREFAVQYPANSGQIYMFSTAENLNKFSANAAGFAEGVRQAMAGGNGRIVR